MSAPHLPGSAPAQLPAFRAAQASRVGALAGLPRSGARVLPNQYYCAVSNGKKIDGEKKPGRERSAVLGPSGQRRAIWGGGHWSRDLDTWGATGSARVLKQVHGVRTVRTLPVLGRP